MTQGPERRTCSKFHSGRVQSVCKRGTARCKGHWDEHDMVWPFQMLPLSWCSDPPDLPQAASSPPSPANPLSSLFPHHPRSFQLPEDVRDPLVATFLPLLRLLSSKNALPSWLEPATLTTPRITSVLLCGDTPPQHPPLPLPSSIPGEVLLPLSFPLLDLPHSCPP